jgi:hypothetical protein
MGTSDGLLVVGQVVFFYDQAPESMKSLGMALSLMAYGMGNMRMTGERGTPWVINDLNASRLDYYYALLTVLAVIDLSVFVGQDYVGLFYKTSGRKNLRTLPVFCSTKPRRGSGVWTIHRATAPSAGDSIRRQWPPPQPPKPSRSSPPRLFSPRFAASPQHGGLQPRRSMPNAALPPSRPRLASAGLAGLRLPSPSSYPARPLPTPQRPRQKVLCVFKLGLLCELDFELS